MALTQVDTRVISPAPEYLISLETPQHMRNIHVRSMVERLANKGQQYDLSLMSISGKDYSFDVGDDKCEQTYLPLTLEIGRVLVNGLHERAQQQHEGTGNSPPGYFMVLDHANIRAQPGELLM